MKQNLLAILGTMPMMLFSMEHVPLLMTEKEKKEKDFFTAAKKKVLATIEIVRQRKIMLEASCLNKKVLQ